MSDEGMDRLLRRAAGSPARPDAAACLDSETIAAFVDGGLSPAQSAAAEAHLADCERCLLLTASVVRTTPPPLPAPRRSWFRAGWLAPLTAVGVVAMAAWLMIRDPAAPVAQSGERAAPLLPSETSKAAVPELRQEPPARTAAERKVEIDAVTPSAPAAAAAPPARPQATADDLARDGLVSPRQAAPQVPMKIVPSPDPAILWRFSEAVLERSTDGGVTWAPHTPGAAGFLAAAAPSADVLWLAGRAGLVLLTTDGRTWQRVDLPDTTSDGVQVTASDGRSARVTTATGSTYRTSDAGRSWVLQENPAGSF